MKWLLALLLGLALPALGAPKVDPLSHIPGWLLLTPPGQVAFQATVLTRRAYELQSTAPLGAISRRLEELRGLKFHYPVRYTIKTPEGVRAFLDSQISMFYPPKRMRRDQKMLELLGMVPPGFELKAFLLDLMEEQIAGAYDPAEDYFFLVLRKASWLSRALKSADEDAMITLHELDHAMQNQHFNLHASQEALAKKADSDQEMAFSALVEGDATSVMYDLILAKQGTNSADSYMSMQSMEGLITALPMPGMGRFHKAPLYFQRQLMFPYLVGCDFVNDTRRQGGWEAVNSIYQELPTSSEQIYHPERYWLRDEPVPVRLKLSLPGWTELGQDTGGEFTARVWLEQHGVANYFVAADGWGGDRMAVYEKGDQSCLVWLTTWDSRADAEEFRAGAEWAIQKAPGKWRVEQSGERVLLTRDLPPALMGRVRTLLP